MNKNKSLSIFGAIAIFLIGCVIFNQMYKHHQANQLIIEKCFDNFEKVEEVVIKKDGFWSPVSCEKK